MQLKTIGKPITLLVSYAIVSCSSPPKIIPSQMSDVIVMNSSYQVSEDLGKSPAELPEDESNLTRIKLLRPGQSPEYLLVLFPQDVEGDIQIKLDSSITGTTSALGAEFYDKILRAHRLLLKGLVQSSKQLVDHIEQQYGEGFGTIILRANIMAAEGKGQEAKKLFRYAQAIYPDSKSLKEFNQDIESLGGGE